MESFSSLKALLKNPKDYFFYKENPFKGNSSTTLGTAVHHIIQGQPDLVRVNEINRTTRVGREEYAIWEEEFKKVTHNEGVIITKSQKEALDKCMDSFRNNIQATNILEGCEFEQPLILDDVFNKVKFKGKVDGIDFVNNKVVEIKTSSALTNAKDFSEGAKDMAYDMQAYMYTEMARKATGNNFEHYFIVVNTTAPFACKVYKSSSEFMQSGAKKYTKALQAYKKYVIDGATIEDPIEEI
jgi:hypothetical protein